MFDDVWMEWTFTGEVIEWRGPAPYLFVAMTPEAIGSARSLRSSCALNVASCPP